MLIFDEVTGKNKLAPFYGPQCKCRSLYLVLMITVSFIMIPLGFLSAVIQEENL